MAHVIATCISLAKCSHIALPDDKWMGMYSPSPPQGGTARHMVGGKDVQSPYHEDRE